VFQTFQTFETIDEPFFQSINPRRKITAQIVDPPIDLLLESIYAPG
jgi:hypothetical protein